MKARDSRLPGSQRSHPQATPAYCAMNMARAEGLQLDEMNRALCGCLRAADSVLRPSKQERRISGGSAVACAGSKDLDRSG